MEKENRKVVTSEKFDFTDIPSIHQYGRETFGLKLADYFIEEIYTSLENLSSQYFLHPECRHLETKTKIPQHHFGFLPNYLQNYTSSN